MKTIKYFLFAAISLLTITGCSNKDSEFYNDIYVSVPDLVTVETVAQSVTIKANVPRFLNDADHDNNLDIYKSTSGAVRLNFTYFLERKIDAVNWGLYEIPQSQLMITHGEALGGQFITAASLYNDVNKIYEYEVAINGLIPGDYRLGFGYNSENTTDVEFRSENIDHNLFLNLNSRLIGLDFEGYYHFTVL